MNKIPSPSIVINDQHINMLADLLAKRSKHSAYQELHPWVRDVLGSVWSPIGKLEKLRWNYIKRKTKFEDTYVMDIGANTGYFSLSSLEAGANNVTAFEGNQDHALFLKETAILLGLTNSLYVVDQYFAFEPTINEPVDIALCLNVLHHLGSDFGEAGQSMASAKKIMKDSLRQLATYAHSCWFQMGFNWKGDRYQPLFENGLKEELIDFVKSSCAGAWSIENIAIYDPTPQCYKTARGEILRRFDEVGEFLNRPLFHLKSCFL